jgi:hypothetical protein
MSHVGGTDGRLEEEEKKEKEGKQGNNDNADTLGALSKRRGEGDQFSDDF